MPFSKTCRLLLVSLALLILAVPAFAQGRRRAVAHPAPSGPALNAMISGTVLDTTTGQPVIGASVQAGDRTASTNTQGKFTLHEVTGYGAIDVAVTRSGYKGSTQKITTGGDHDLTFRLDPTPTVRVRKTDGTTYDLDFESLKFGYGVPFSGYRDGEDEEFCTVGEERITIHRNDMRRITGPAVRTSQSGCCASNQLLRVNLELKNGQKSDVIFADSCHATHVDLIGRDHVAGTFRYIHFTEIAEVVFP